MLCDHQNLCGSMTPQKGQLSLVFPLSCLLFTMWSLNCLLCLLVFRMEKSPDTCRYQHLRGWQWDRASSGYKRRSRPMTYMGTMWPTDEESVMSLSTPECSLSQTHSKPKSITGQSRAWVDQGGGSQAKLQVKEGSSRTGWSEGSTFGQDLVDEKMVDTWVTWVL
jgi:hypothetical protein